MTPALISAIECVEEMVADGAAFGDVEDFIDSLSLDDEEKSVLWLLAWAEQPSDYRRMVITEAG